MHGRPRLSSYGRQLIVERLASGRHAALVAEELGVSRATVFKWWRRYRHEGWLGLEDRSSRPHSSPSRLSSEVEARILELRRLRKLGPHRLAVLTGHPVRPATQSSGATNCTDWTGSTGQPATQFVVTKPNGPASSVTSM